MRRIYSTAFTTIALHVDGSYIRAHKHRDNCEPTDRLFTLIHLCAQLIIYGKHNEKSRTYTADYFSPLHDVSPSRSRKIRAVYALLSTCLKAKVTSRVSWRVHSESRKPIWKSRWTIWYRRLIRASAFARSAIVDLVDPPLTIAFVLANINRRRDKESSTPCRRVAGDQKTIARASFLCRRWLPPTQSSAVSGASAKWIK